jgi:peptidyl-dipeptidase A
MRLRPMKLRAALATLTLTASIVALAPASHAAPATAAEVQAVESFLAASEAELLELWIEQQRTAWIAANFITHDTELVSAAANEKLIAKGVELAQKARAFNDLELPAELRRKLEMLKLSLVLPAPSDPAKTEELAKIAASLEGTYGRGKYCRTGKDGKEECLYEPELTNIIGTSRDPAELLEAWKGWHAIAPPMRKDYQRLVELANEGARELGYSDVGAMWRSKYDMAPDAFAAELDRLFEQIKPLYEALHCHVRAKLVEKYGPEVVPPSGPIPAHLLGNMWAQSWSNLYDLVGPQNADKGYDLTKALVAKGLDAQAMVKVGEEFFTSLGFEPLPATFWERSLFTKPRDRDVVCHASAWDIDFVDDLRIKMCIEVDAEDFSVIHHELGHNFYQRAYAHQSPLYRDSANDGFHEAVGDTVALSITPPYLVKLGLIEKEPPASGDLGFLTDLALDKVAFLPFALVIDNWRWQVFSGAATAEQYNQAWWDLRLKYQGVAPPVARSEADFDPGAKYHVPGNTPYMRYFLAHILQFQFHRALCKEAGFEGPLHRCSIYGSDAAGKKLRDMLAMGSSRPWPEALAAGTGEKAMDATAVLDYFAPVKTWLDEQNQGRTCGW